VNCKRDLATEGEARQDRLPSFVLTPETATPPCGGVRRVLLADDHHINHLTIQAMLEDRGIEVVCAFDGAEALRTFSQGGFDRVLMDIDMPGMDGITAVRAIRAFEAERGAPRTPISMFTALSGRDIEEEARQAGADDYLTKPITLNQLYAFMGPVAASR
jgi:CheY-like chemotaxis protein